MKKFIPFFIAVFCRISIVALAAGKLKFVFGMVATYLITPAPVAIPSARSFFAL